MYHHIEGHYREEQPHDYWAIETHLDNEGVEGSWKRVPAMMASGQKKGSTHTVWEEIIAQTMTSTCNRNYGSHASTSPMWKNALGWP